MPVAAIGAPPDCAQETRGAPGRRISPSVLNGRNRWLLTKAGAIKTGNPNDPDIGNVVTMTVRDGRWLLGGGDNDGGTYEIVGDRRVFDWPQVASTLTFTFKRPPTVTWTSRPCCPWTAATSSSGPARPGGAPDRRSCRFPDGVLSGDRRRSAARP
jgi:hypothetical protein